MVLQATPHVTWAPLQLQARIDSFGDLEAQVVLFEVKWLGRQQRRTTAFQEKYSSRLCGIFFQTLVQEYDPQQFLPSIHLFKIKVVKCKLCESSSMFSGMKMLPRAVCSSTHYALVVIRLWTSCMLMMNQIYFRMEQSPGSCFLCACAMHYFDVIRCGKACNRSADIAGKVEKVFILFGIDRSSSPTSW